LALRYPIDPGLVLEPAGTAGHQDQVVARRGQQIDRGGADTAAGAGDQRDGTGRIGV
jgi:hypothetical protein